MDGEIIEKESTDRYSFSKLSCFEDCPYAYYLHYVLTKEERDAGGYIKESNYYAENGSLCHDVLQKFFAGEINEDDLAAYYIERYDAEICYQVRQSIMDKTFEACADYFASETFDWMKGWKIVGIEMKVEMLISGYKYIGFIDLLLQNEETGEYWLIDHKSAPYPFKKNGDGVLAKCKDSFESYKKQMYLYSHAIKETFGAFPTKITWNHFKDGGKLATIPFKEEEYNEAMSWFTTTIADILKEENYEAKLEFFHCHNLCDYRNSCEYLEDSGNE